MSIVETTPINEVAKNIAGKLANQFKKTAVNRDHHGGNAKFERDLIRESGLLKLLIPVQYGGLGGTWLDVLDVVHIFAKVDSSLAHIYGYHFVNLTTAELCGTEEQAAYYYKITADENLFWGNAFNPLNLNLIAKKENDQFILNGSKTFCSGSVDSDYLLVSAHWEGQDEPVLAAIPSNSIGVHIKEDWDNFGQRQTDSGTVVFEDVVVPADAVFRNGFNRDEFSRLRINISNFILNHIFLGIIEGAIDDAKAYTLTKTRVHAPYINIIDVPHIRRHHAEFYVEAKAAKLLVEDADQLFQQLWLKRNDISPEDRRKLDEAAYSAKIYTTKVGLDITSRIFEVMGSRATSNQYGFDRYWRNLRTMTLHVPIDNTLQDLGQIILEGARENSGKEETEWSI